MPSSNFHIIAQHSKGAHYFHRVVGLVVINICQWYKAHIQYRFCAACLTHSAICISSVFDICMMVECNK